MSHPAQFTTADGTLLGNVDGLNPVFTFIPYPTVFQYAVPLAAGNVLFRNGILQDRASDYTESRGYFIFTDLETDGVLTARIFSGAGGFTQLNLNSGIYVTSPVSLRIGVQPGRSTLAPFMLFRNGQLLTGGDDYAVVGPWVTLVTDQEILPDDDFIMLIGTGGFPCSTLDGSIAGAIDGTNATFVLPTPEFMLFRNGQLLTAGFDYVQSGSTVTLLGSQIPIVSDTLTAQAWTSGGPTQATTVDGTIFHATAAEALMYLNGLMETQPFQGRSIGDTVRYGQAPAVGTIPNVLAWTVNIQDLDEPALNLPQQFSTADGSILGVLGGNNAIFTLNTGLLVTDMVLTWNGGTTEYGVDFVWTCLQNSSAGPWITTITMLTAPLAADLLTAEVFIQ